MTGLDSSLVSKSIVCFLCDCQLQLEILFRTEANGEIAALHKIGEVAFGGRIYLVRSYFTKVKIRNKRWLDIKQIQIGRISSACTLTILPCLSG